MAKADPDMQNYYAEARIPLQRHQWEYLKLRKSWFIVPLNWDRFAEADCKRILDVGCGDGDVTQRVAALIENICRVTRKAVYIEDLADKYPGGFPRDGLDVMFSRHGFTATERHWQLTEPFSLFKVPDPCSNQMTWPIQKDQVLWLEREKQDLRL